MPEKDAGAGKGRPTLRFLFHLYLLLYSFLETDDIMREKENMQRLKSELETKQTEILQKEVDIEFAMDVVKSLDIFACLIWNC